MLAVGSAPAEFSLTDHHGQQVSWTSFRGRPVVVFFYPKASTPGCTREACAFRDLHGELDALGVAVVGMSADAVKAQAKFAAAQGLTYPLLADPDRVVLGPWGVWRKKKLYGREYDGIVRSTFLFDAAGVVVRAWDAVKVDGHADEVVAAARALVGA